jgi:hypothetical protein
MNQEYFINSILAVMAAAIVGFLIFVAAAQIAREEHPRCICSPEALKEG